METSRAPTICPWTASALMSCLACFALTANRWGWGTSDFAISGILSWPSSLTNPVSTNG